ncbi:hypothetical protein TGAM01_v209412 [Trichoderma gamsii]|uniref:Zn(2)-C6 fungal-type domain-containing protein n=1 Tax=Trichoderma gamsii TaxID=398673 RepID=A0A2P4ZBJ7_9HYPO|nr:hypothetical protein TGAM01_v209412 [Trichoderma gamsii]PON21674.1 hypothetical protein TGAM01_v209412 [Trichoderma gamsii]
MEQPIGNDKSVFVTSFMERPFYELSFEASSEFKFLIVKLLPIIEFKTSESLSKNAPKLHREICLHPKLVLHPRHHISEPAAQEPNKKRKIAIVACDTCREKKIACEGQRPCVACKRASRTCNYQVSRGNAAQTVQQLRSLPYDEAIQLLHTLRSSTELKLSPALSADHSPARNSLEFELLNRHVVAYPPLFPVQVGSLPLRELLRPTRLQIESFLFSLSSEFVDVLGFYSQAAALSVAFFDEAMSILPLELTQDSITAMAAIQILSITVTAYAKDKCAVRLVQAGVKMGKRMGVFGCQASTELPIPPACKENSWKRAVSFTTWGTFNWVSLHCLHYQTVEVEPPSAIPMPGDLMDLPDPESSEAVASRIDCTVFHASCKLWAIFNEVLWKYYSERSPSLEFAESIYRKLLLWAQTLPLDLIRGRESSHAETIMHMYLHIIVADVFRPFVRSPHPSQRLKSFTSAQAVPEGIYAASMNQLKRLVLAFRENFKNAAYSVFWQTSLIYLANAMVSEAKSGDPEGRFYLELCLAGMEDLYGSFRISKVIVQSLLSMALREGTFSYDEARRVAAELELLGRHHTAAICGHALDADEEDIEISWIFNLDLALENHDAARAGNQAQNYEELMALDEFTTGLTGENDSNMTNFAAMSGNYLMLFILREMKGKKTSSGRRTIALDRALVALTLAIMKAEAIPTGSRENILNG